MPTDTERMDFLDTLRNRTVFMDKENPHYYINADIYISGPDSCSIYVRNEFGESEYKGRGNSIREAIDEVISAMDHK